MPIEQRNVGMVFQSYALFPNMNVAENIGYGLKIPRASAQERKARVAELVALTGIEGLEHRRIDQLSGGQRQRVALARAVAVRPSVLLLDEPLTALDAALRERLRGELDRLLRTLGITTIYVTHDQAEAMALGDRIVVMRKGAIAQVGTPRDIYFAPASRFVAEFVGAANILEAREQRRRPDIARWPTGDREDERRRAVARDGAPGIDRHRRGGGREPDPARSTSVSFVGDRQRLTVSGAADRPIMVDVPNTLMVKVGDRVGSRSIRRRSGCLPRGRA